MSPEKSGERWRLSRSTWWVASQVWVTKQSTVGRGAPRGERREKGRVAGSEG